MNCLDENAALSFLEGRLSAAKLGDVEGHLSTCEACRELVAGSAGLALSVTAPSENPVFVALRSKLLERGATIGRYVVLDLVGRGAMGEVYAAFDPQLNRKVALKLIKGDGAKASEVGQAHRRLLREAKAIARLSHPNTVVVHDAGEIGGRVFIAMEFIEGQTLNEWMRSARHSWRETVEMFLAAGRGLAAAHAAGLVHRDFKPHNVMVGNDGAVRVMDFGLASESDAELREEDPLVLAVGVAGAKTVASATGDVTGTMGPAMTRTGMLLGTPAYMAPEQFLAEPADARSDQFSFCVALYEALYGERPFEGSTVAELAVTVTVGRLRDAPARARVPARLRRILARGLQRVRAQRFPSMEVLLAELARDPERRRRRLTIGVAVAVLLVVVGAGAQRTILRPVSLCRGAGEHLTGIWELGGAAGTTPRRDAIRAAFSKVGGASGGDTWQRVSATLDRFARAWTTMSTESCEATHVRGEQSTSVLDLRTTCLGAGLQKLRALTDVFAAADLDVVRQAVDAANALPDLTHCADVKALLAVTPLPSDRETRAKIESLRRRLAEAAALHDAGKMAAAAPLAHALVTDARALGYDPTLAEALMLACWLEGQGGDRAAALAQCEEALWAAEASRDDEVGATAATQLAGNSFAHAVESRRWVHFASAILKRMGPGHEKIEGWLAHNQATDALEMGDPAGARAFYERAIALKTAAEGADHPDVAISLNSYGNMLHELGDDAGGLAAIRRAAGIFEHAYGPRNRWVGMMLSDEGEILTSAGRAGDALPIFETSVAIVEEDTDANNPWLAYPLTGKGRTLLALGRPREAIAVLERALAIRDRGEDLPLPRGETRFALARALWEADADRARARTLAASAREEYRRATKAEKNVAEIDAWLAAHRKG
jgi:tRNA A-37 threonylcarbamoyl transferase component Bud32/tetratricopeptide (TPR) repeat protein